MGLDKSANELRGLTSLIGFTLRANCAKRTVFGTYTECLLDCRTLVQERDQLVELFLTCGESALNMQIGEYIYTMMGEIRKRCTRIRWGTVSHHM